MGKSFLAKVEKRVSVNVEIECIAVNTGLRKPWKLRSCVLAGRPSERGYSTSNTTRSRRLPDHADRHGVEETPA